MLIILTRLVENFNLLPPITCSPNLTNNNNEMSKIKHKAYVTITTDLVN